LCCFSFPFSVLVQNGFFHVRLPGGMVGVAGTYGCTIGFDLISCTVM
jgi:hypothetical protein